jgi:hypothetical protein
VHASQINKTAKAFSKVLIFLLFALWLQNCSRIEDPAGPESGKTHSLTMDFSRMQDLKGLVFSLSIINISTRETVVETTFVFPDQNTYSLSFAQVLDSGQSYNIDFSADLNKNGDYDAPPLDMAWRLVCLGVSEDIHFSFSPNVDYTDIGISAKERYDLVFKLTGFDTIASKMLGLRIIDSVYGSVQADTSFFIQDTDSIEITMDSVLVSGRSYRIDIFADISGNLAYDAPPVDAAWQIQVGKVSTNKSLEFAYDTLYTTVDFPADSVFNLTFVFRGLDAQLNRLFYIKVIDTLSGTAVDSQKIAAITSPEFSLEFKEVLEKAKSYRLDFFIDQNWNGNFDTLPVDQMWRVPVYNVQCDTAITFQHDSNFTGIGFEPESLFNLTLILQGMVPHIGKMMQFKVVDNQWGKTVMETTLVSVPGSEFALSLGQVMVKNLVYNIEFYVDNNTNFTFDYPPDYVWRVQPAEALWNDTVSFIHNATFAADVVFDPNPRDSLKALLIGVVDSQWTTAEWPVKLVDVNTGSTVWDTVLPGITPDAHELNLGEVLVPGRIFHLDLFADLDNSGSLEFPAEPAWREVITGGDAAQEVYVFCEQANVLDISRN